MSSAKVRQFGQFKGFFTKKFGSERNGWQLFREGEILYHHQKTFVPDFTFRHEDSTEVLLEIVDFWTKEYILTRPHFAVNFTSIAVNNTASDQGTHLCLTNYSDQG